MRHALIFVVGILPLFGGGISPAEYKQRQTDLRRSLEGLMVLFGAEEPE